MTHPLFHSQKSVELWGGKVEDYLPIHSWLDETKETFCDFRHRALRHHSQGIFEAERQFGIFITNSCGNQVPVRYIGEQHIKEDCGGRVPSVADWFRNIKPESWMSRGYKVEMADISTSSLDATAITISRRRDKFLQRDAGMYGVGLI